MPAQLPPMRVLVVDDEPGIRTTLEMCLQAAGHSAALCATAGEAMEKTAAQTFDIVLLDLRLGNENGMDFIEPLRAASPWAKIVVITAYASIGSAVEAMRRGAADYLPKPFTPEQVEILVNKLAEVRRLELRLQELEQSATEAGPDALILPLDPATAQALELARQLAGSNTAILLTGESGTGRSLLARSIHVWGTRSAGPFATVSCALREEEDLRRELFGAGDQPGKIETCEGGTLHVQEIAGLAARDQEALLHLIQQKQFERAGETRPRTADVRLVLSSSVDIEAAMRGGKLREDLYYTMTGKAVHLPPLRQRGEDLRHLAIRFLAHYAAKQRIVLAGFSSDAEAILLKYHWPGNVRELRNVIERAAILARADGTKSGRVEARHLPPNITSHEGAIRLGNLVPLEVIEELHIRGVLAATRNLETAARVLGIDYATLWRRRKKYGL